MQAIRIEERTELARGTEETLAAENTIHLPFNLQLREAQGGKAKKTFVLQRSLKQDCAISIPVLILIHAPT